MPAMSENSQPASAVNNDIVFSSSNTPAMAWSSGSGQQLCLAYTSGDGYIDYATFKMEGVGWSGPGRALYNGNPFGIQNGPAITVFNGKFYVAHRGTRWGSYSGQEIWCTTFDGTNWSQDTVITDAAGGHPNTFNHPALAVFKGRLYLAHRGTKWGNYTGNEIWVTSSSDGVNWTVDTPVPNVFSDDAPALAVFNDTLYLAHRGSYMYYEGSTIWYTTTTDGINWSTDQNVKDANGGVMGISGAPALATARDQLYLAHRGTRWANYTGNELWLTSFDGHTWATDALVLDPRYHNPYQIYSSPALAADPVHWLWWSAVNANSELYTLAT
jgi:hypothetical protein